MPAMAEDLMKFMNELGRTVPPPFTSPQVYYGAKEDVLTIYFHPGESYAHRLNKLVTIFLSFQGDELIGCQVKGLRRKLESDGDFSIRIRKDGKVELGLFFHLLAYEMPEPGPRNRLVELGQLAKGFELDERQLHSAR